MTRCSVGARCGSSGKPGRGSRGLPGSWVSGPWPCVRGGCRRVVHVPVHRGGRSAPDRCPGPATGTEAGRCRCPEGTGGGGIPRTRAADAADPRSTHVSVTRVDRMPARGAGNPPRAGSAFRCRAGSGLPGVLPDGGAGPLDPGNEEFAVDAATPPTGVLPREPHHREPDGATARGLPEGFGREAAVRRRATGARCRRGTVSGRTGDLTPRSTPEDSRCGNAHANARPSGRNRAPCLHRAVGTTSSGVTDGGNGASRRAETVPAPPGTTSTGARRPRTGPPRPDARRTPAAPHHHRTVPGRADVPGRRRAARPTARGAAPAAAPRRSVIG
ncbi:hypothetical protein SAMN05216505_102475 [Streptomyces prasinopilosus]|uniref:Uncharacterized protein n=1 Tax=Streptomyces prasinopilosus TaxID=67344 RepID=A0A1G6MD76_9ACTN|nr:hypothetical protein SAMN05216505_102475 [Streptomyces prasinopilosus]